MPVTQLCAATELLKLRHWDLVALLHEAAYCMHHGHCVSPVGKQEAPATGGVLNTASGGPVTRRVRDELSIAA